MTGQSYRYRSEDAAPGIDWYDRLRWRPAVPYVPAGWMAWACLTREHRYHRTKAAAARCAGIILPRIEDCEIVGGAVFLLFGAMNYYTHIGMYFNIAHGTMHLW